MAVLENFGRMTVPFIPHDYLHRQFYFEFVKNNTWGNCPVRFEVVKPYNDVVTMIKARLLDYYMEREQLERTAKVAQK